MTLDSSILILLSVIEPGKIRMRHRSLTVLERHFMTIFMGS